MAISIAELRGAGIRFEATEAVAIAQQLISSLRDRNAPDQAEPPYGPPSAANAAGGAGARPDVARSRGVPGCRRLADRGRRVRAHPPRADRRVANRADRSVCPDRVCPDRADHDCARKAAHPSRARPHRRARCGAAPCPRIAARGAARVRQAPSLDRSNTSAHVSGVAFQLAPPARPPEARVAAHRVHGRPLVHARTRPAARPWARGARI